MKFFFDALLKQVIMIILITQMSGRTFLLQALQNCTTCKFIQVYGGIHMDIRDLCFKKAKLYRIILFLNN